MSHTIEIDGELVPVEQVGFLDLREGDYWTSSKGRAYKVTGVRRYGDPEYGSASVTLDGAGTATASRSYCPNYWRVIG